MAASPGIDPSRLLHEDLGRLLGDEQLAQAYHERRQDILDAQLGLQTAGGTNAVRQEASRGSLSSQVAATSANSLRRLPSLQASAFEEVNLGADDMLLQAFRFARGAPDTRVLYVPDDEKSSSQSATTAQPKEPQTEPDGQVKGHAVQNGSNEPTYAHIAPASGDAEQTSVSKRRSRRPLALDLGGASNKEPPPPSPSDAETPVLDSARRDAILVHAHRPVALPDASVPQHLASHSPSAQPAAGLQRQPQQAAPAAPNTRRRRRLISGHLQSPEVQGVMRGVDSVLGALHNDSSDDEVDRVRWGRQAPPSRAKGWSKFSQMVHTGAWRESGGDDEGGSSSGQRRGGSAVSGLRQLVLAAQHNVKSAAARDPREWQLDAIRVTGQKRRRRNRAMARRLSSEQQFLAAQKAELAPLLSPAAARDVPRGAPSVRAGASTADLSTSASAPALGSLQAAPRSSLGLSASELSTEGPASGTAGARELPPALASAFDSARSADVDAALIEADALLGDGGAGKWGEGGEGGVDTPSPPSAAELAAAAAAKRARKAVQLRAYGGKSVHPAITSAESAAAMLAHPATRPVKGGSRATGPPAEGRSEANNPKSPYKLGVLSSTVNPRWRAWAYHYDRTQGTAQAELHRSKQVSASGQQDGSGNGTGPWAVSALPVSPMGREVAALRSTLGAAGKLQGGEGGSTVRGPGGQRVHQLRMLRASAMGSSSKPVSPTPGDGPALSLGARSDSTGSAQQRAARRGGKLHRQLARASQQWGEGGVYEESSSSDDEAGPAASGLSALEGAVADMERQVAVDEGRSRATLVRGGHALPAKQPEQVQTASERKDGEKPGRAQANGVQGGVASAALERGRVDPERPWVLPVASGLDAPACLGALGNWSRHPSRKWAQLPLQGAVTQHASWAMRAARAEASVASPTAGAAVAARPGPGMGEDVDPQGAHAMRHVAVLHGQRSGAGGTLRDHMQGGDIWLMDRAHLGPATSEASDTAHPQHRVEGSVHACVPIHALPRPSEDSFATPVPSGAAASEAAVKRLTAHLLYKAPAVRSAAPPKPGTRRHSSAIGRSGLLEAAQDPQAEQRATVAAREAHSAAHSGGGGTGGEEGKHASMQERSQQQKRSHHVSATVALISHPSINPRRQVDALRSWTLTQLAGVAADAETFGRTIPVDAADSVVSAVFEAEGGTEDGTDEGGEGGGSPAQLLQMARQTLQGAAGAVEDAVGIAGRPGCPLPTVQRLEKWLLNGSQWAMRQAERRAGADSSSEQAAVLSAAKARFIAQWQQLTRSPLSAVLEAGVSLRPRAAMRQALADALATDQQRLDLREEVAQAALEHSISGAEGPASLDSRARAPLRADHFLRSGVLADDHPESVLAFLRRAAAAQHAQEDEVGAWGSNSLLEGMWAARGAIHAASGVMEVCRSATAQLAQQLAEQCAEEGEALRLVWRDVRDLWEVDAVLAEADAACVQQDADNVLASLADLTHAVQQETAQSDVLLAVVESQYSALASLVQRADSAGVPLGALSTAQLRSAAAILTRNAAAAGLRKDEVLSSSTIRSVLQSVRESVGGGGSKHVPPSQRMRQPPSREQRGRKGGVLSGVTTTHGGGGRPGPPSRPVAAPPGTPKPGFDPSKVHLQQRGLQADTTQGTKSSLSYAAEGSSFAFSDDSEDSQGDSSQ